VRKIAITFEESGVMATAVLLDAQAPKTCDAMWQVLAEPLVQEGIHAGWAGREVSIAVPQANRVIDPTQIPKENLTLYPIPGDICFGYFPPGYGVGITEEYWDLALIYGRETRFEFSFGPAPMTLWATIDEGLEGIAQECERIRTEGLKTIRVSRVG
jgi:Protein of unknown function (DUF3830)